MPDPREVALTGSVRDNLFAALTIMTDTLAGRAESPSLEVMAQVLREPELRKAFGAGVIEPRLRLIEAVLRDAADRGEIGPESADPLIARTGPALVLQAFFLHGKPPSKKELARIVDTILMPLLRR